MSSSDERRGHHRRVFPVALLALTLLASTACGARWTDDQAAELKARTTAGAGRSVSGNEDTGTDTGVIDGGGTTTGGTAGGTTGGTAGGAGGTTGGSGGQASGPLPCAAASDAPGVTDDQITFATITTLTGVVPGLGQSALAAVQAYVAHRNASGGVCGRKLVLKTADDGQDNGRYRSLATELNPSILGIVGGIGGGDAGGADVVPSLGIPVVAVPISDGFQNAATVFDTNPPFA
ncbi:MAG: ABC transporter substrate-binding protein, partial [Actinomycetota bacterium]|nr:ABC transporter substrate-binding protein [Actinomycetota bacterium]